jgi:hypothetical protein
MGGNNLFRTVLYDALRNRIYLPDLPGTRTPDTRIVAYNIPATRPTGTELATAPILRIPTNQNALHPDHSKCSPSAVDRFLFL